MALTIEDCARGVYGAVLLARGDPRGLAVLDTSREGAIKSFVAAVVILPAYVVTRLVEEPRLMAAPMWQALAIEALIYIILWTIVPAAMTWIAPAIGRGDRLHGVIASYNWAMVIQGTALLPLVLLEAAGAGGFLLSLAVMALVVGLLVYEAFVLKVALAVPWLPAVALVAAIYTVVVALARWSGSVMFPAAG